MTHPATTNKAALSRFEDLPQESRVMCEYVWIDGTGEGIRSKCRTMEFEPQSPEGRDLLFVFFLFHFTFYCYTHHVTVLGLGCPMNPIVQTCAFDYRTIRHYNVPINRYVSFFHSLYMHYM